MSSAKGADKVIPDKKLREDSLAYYQEDVDRLDSELDAFLELSGARCALLIDRNGHLVTRRGEALRSPLESISALIAGSFAATKEMARLLGEEEFTIMFHQGVRDSIQLQLIGARTLLAVLFDERTNLGLVRFYAQEAGLRVEEVLERASRRDRSIVLSDSFQAEATQALDDLF